jgi:eukaryotic-like serine/threonine-protein kinase
VPAQRNSSPAIVASAAPVSGLDGTVAVPPSHPAHETPSIVRGGGPRDYPELQPVDPKHFVLGPEIARGGMGRILKAATDDSAATSRSKSLSPPPATRVRGSSARCGSQRSSGTLPSSTSSRLGRGAEPFYVMKLVDGISLDRKIAGCKTLPDRLALLPNLTTVVEALAFAHGRKVIHRDLKPANVLVGSFGETVVIDWGLAKELDSVGDVASRTDFRGPFRDARGGETMAGSVMGTPSYMPAEQATGEDVDERADVYALGAMLYHVLAGVPPFTGKTTGEILNKVIAGPPQRLDEVVHGVPSDLVAIVAKVIAFRDKDRYQDAGKLAEELRRFQTGQRRCTPLHQA